jgi:anti-sigma B factor antagonist
MTNPDAKNMQDQEIISVATSRHSGTVVVHVSGEIDVSSVGPMRTTLLEELAERPRGLVIDLTAVDFCGSTGLQALCEARTRAESTLVELRLVATRPVVLRILDITGTRQLFTVHNSVPEALRALVA